MKQGAGKERRKRHHFVPQGYLKAWADENNQIAVRNRKDAKCYLANTKNVALEADLYTAYSFGKEPDDHLEEMLGDEIDGPAPVLLSRLAEGKLPRKDSDDRSEISKFLAMQFVRTPDRIDQSLFVPSVLEASGSPRGPVGKDVVRAYLAHRRLGEMPSDREVEAAADWVNGMLAQPGPMPSRDDAIKMMFRIAKEHLAPVIRDKAWSVEIDPDGRFLTADLPVSKYWSPAKRKMYKGVGLQDADEIRFPIDPRHLLVLRPQYPENRSVVSGDRVKAVNVQVANRCYRQVIAMPGATASLEQLVIQPRPMALRFNTGPLLRDGADGIQRADGTVLHFYVEHPDD